MGSPTKKHKTRRVAKLAKSGKARKNQVRIHGTTAPNLPLDRPNASELKQAAALAKPVKAVKAKAKAAAV